MTAVLELNLSACNVRAAEAEGKRRFIFQLNTAEGESLYFNADTKASLERWIEVISVVATSREESSVTCSEEEIDKIDEVKHCFSLRWLSTILYVLSTCYFTRSLSNATVFTTLKHLLDKY